MAVTSRSVMRDRRGPGSAVTTPGRRLPAPCLTTCAPCPKLSRWCQPTRGSRFSTTSATCSNRSPRRRGPRGRRRRVRVGTSWPSWPSWSAWPCRSRRRTRKPWQRSPVISRQWRPSIGGWLCQGTNAPNRGIDFARVVRERSAVLVVVGARDVPRPWYALRSSPLARTCGGSALTVTGSSGCVRSTTGRGPRPCAHVLICMLAAYLTWHLRKALAPLTSTDEQPPAQASPVAPDPRPLHRRRADPRSFRGLISHLATLTRTTTTTGGPSIDKISEPAPVQRPRIRPHRHPDPVGPHPHPYAGKTPAPQPRETPAHRHTDLP